MAKSSIRIASRKGGGVLSAWLDNDEIFIRESLDRGRDVQTVAVTRDELLKILALKDPIPPEHLKIAESGL